MATLVKRNILGGREGEMSLALAPETDTNELVALKYDYTQIDDEKRGLVRGVAMDIKNRIERTKRDILSIGKGLVRVKETLPHGQFTDWCQTEFGMSDRSARNVMGVYERFGDRPEMIPLFSDTALYQLSAPNVTENAIAAAAEEAKEAGKSPTKARIEEIIIENKDRRGGDRKSAMRDTGGTHEGESKNTPDVHEKTETVSDFQSNTRVNFDSGAKCLSLAETEVLIWKVAGGKGSTDKEKREFLRTNRQPNMYTHDLTANQMLDGETFVSALLIVETDLQERIFKVESKQIELSLTAGKPLPALLAEPVTDANRDDRINALIDQLNGYIEGLEALHAEYVELSGDSSSSTYLKASLGLMIRKLRLKSEL